jgi:DNA-binding transcriptional LysR family regulator
VNVHHLELFYYVARYKGVSSAARQMPYGIQQPAISAQILQLEDSLGTTLFHRRPFKLTEEGEKLFRHITPFFSGLVELGNELRGGKEKRLRIATPEIVQRDYLPALMLSMKKRVPDFQFTLASGRIEDIESMLLEQEIDLGFSTLNSTRTDAIRTRSLIKMPLVLLVPRDSRYKKADEILGKDRISTPLISLPAPDTVSRLFQEGLRKRRLDWFPSLEVSSLDIVSRYVAEGFGVGLSVSAPKSISDDHVRPLTLEGFPLVEFGAMWLGKLSPIAEVLLNEASGVLGRNGV